MVCEQTKLQRLEVLNYRTINSINLLLSLEPSVTHDYMGPMSQWIAQARAMFKDVDESEEIEFLRFRTKKQEFMIVPDLEAHYLLIVIMNLLEK